MSLKLGLWHYYLKYENEMIQIIDKYNNNIKIVMDPIKNYFIDDYPPSIKFVSCGSEYFYGKGNSTLCLFKLVFNNKSNIYYIELVFTSKLADECIVLQNGSCIIANHNNIIMIMHLSNPKIFKTSPITIKYSSQIFALDFDKFVTYSDSIRKPSHNIKFKTLRIYKFDDKFDKSDESTTTAIIPREIYNEEIYGDMELMQIWNDEFFFRVLDQKIYYYISYIFNGHNKLIKNKKSKMIPLDGAFYRITDGYDTNHVFSERPYCNRIVIPTLGLIYSRDELMKILGSHILECIIPMIFAFI